MKLMHGKNNRKRRRARAASRVANMINMSNNHGSNSAVKHDEPWIMTSWNGTRGTRSTTRTRPRQLETQSRMDTMLRSQMKKIHSQTKMDILYTTHKCRENERLTAAFRCDICHRTRRRSRLNRVTSWKHHTTKHGQT